jgi:hypothetical protein
MTPTALVRVAGVLGGVAWLAGAVVDRADGAHALVNSLHWGGTALILIALLGLGAGLVSGLLALRVVVAVCLAVLAWAVVEWLRSDLPDPWVDGTFGLLLALYCLGSLRRRRRLTRAYGEPDGPRAPRPRRSGTHAA